MKAITEKTLVPISLVVALIGGVLWLTSINSQAQTSTESIKALRTQISSLEQKKDAQLDLLMSIDRRLSRIEGKMGVK